MSPGNVPVGGTSTSNEVASEIAPLAPLVRSHTPLPCHHVPTFEDAINFDHMELLVHVALDKDIFSLGVGIEDYHRGGLSLGLREALQAPYLMHQVLAFSARHLAFLHPEKSDSYLQKAVTLQTRAVSLFTAIPINVDETNCVPMLLFSTILGHHLLADTLSKRPATGIDSFLEYYVQCAQTYRGVYNIAVSAWPLLMKSELGDILSLSQSFTSRLPVGTDCQDVLQLVDMSTDLDPAAKEACRSAIQYLQIGLDAAVATNPQDTPINRFQMISEWTMLVNPEFTNLLASRRPEALIVLAHYALLLHYGRQMWQVQDAGAYILDQIGRYLRTDWDHWLEYPRRKVAEATD